MNNNDNVKEELPDDYLNNEQRRVIVKQKENESRLQRLLDFDRKSWLNAYDHNKYNRIVSKCFDICYNSNINCLTNCSSKLSFSYEISLEFMLFNQEELLLNKQKTETLYDIPEKFK